MTSKLKIECIECIHESKEIRIKASSDVFLSHEEIREIKEDFCKKIGYDNLDLELSCLDCMIKTLAKPFFWEDMLTYIQEMDKSAWALLEGSKCELIGDRLEVSLDKRGKTILKEKRIDAFISSRLRSLWDKEIIIDFKDNEHMEIEEEKPVNGSFNPADYARAMEESIRKNMDNLNGKGKRNYKGKNSLNYNSKGQLPKDSQGNEILLGKEISKQIISIDRVVADSSDVVCEGQIFKSDFRTLSTGSILASIYITDKTHAICAKFFFNTEFLEIVQDHLSKGKHLRVFGKADIDKYTRELTIDAKSIILYEPEKKTDDALTKRVELHLHTNMSAQDAITRPDQLIERALEWGHKAIAITDHGVVQAYPQVYKAAKGKDIKIIYGVECYLTGQDREMPLHEAKKYESHHCILLAKNKLGLKNLYKLISKSHIDHFYRTPRIPRYVLKEHREGLIVGSACVDGEVYKSFLNKASQEEKERIGSFYDYLEIQPSGNNMFLIREGILNRVEEIEEINRGILELGDKLGKLTIATGDVHFLEEGDSIYRAVMMAGQGYQDIDVQPPLYYRTTQEMVEEFPYLGERAYEVVVENTNKIGDLVEKICPIPPSFYPPLIPGSDDELKEQTYKRAHELYGEDLPGIVKNRLEKELGSIIKNGFSVMYITAKRLVDNSKNNGYIVGSRGSVGSSFAANMAGITEVNSLPAHYLCGSCYYCEFHENEGFDCGYDLEEKDCPKCGSPLNRLGFDIPFETFLGFEGDKIPDIDLNFSSFDQANAHKYTEELFGSEHVFRAGTISGLAEKSAKGYAMKYLEERGRPFEEAVISWLASGFEGVKRTTGQHPGGLIVIPKDMEIYDFTPIQRPADKTDSETITTHFDYNFLQDSILKLDILGHDGPTIIRFLEDFTRVSSEDADISDKKVLSLFNSNEALNLLKDKAKIDIELGSLGIPELGTRFVRSMLEETRPTTISELVRISGLSHGTDVWIGNTRDLIQEKVCTLSEAICCRDDIMLDLINMGLDKQEAFNITESVRKGKGLTKKQEKEMGEKGVPNWYIESCKKIKYMFPKAHAVAYVVLSVKIAWYKVYYPLAFYATYFSVKVDDFDSANMIHGSDKAYSEYLATRETDNSVRKDSLMTSYEIVLEMYARGFEFLSIDIYKSDALMFTIEGGKLRPALGSLAGIGQAAAESIVNARQEGDFLSVEDLRIRSGINKLAIEILRQEGCFDDMPESNQLSLFDF